MSKTDEELFANYIEGDEDCLTTLFNRYRPILLRYLRGRVRDHSSADEIVQLTFIRIVKHKDRFTPGKMFKPWAYTIADRLSRDQRKVSARRSERIKSFSDYDTIVIDRPSDDVDVFMLCSESARGHTTPPADESICEKEQANQAISLLHALPKTLRNTIQFSVVQGLSSREASPVFGVSHVQIQNRLRSGLDILRKQMESGLHGEQISIQDVEECTIRDIVDSLPESEYQSVQRVVFEETGTDYDYEVFARFIRRLVGELVSSVAEAA